jgi:hypothetical protein
MQKKGQIERGVSNPGRLISSIIALFAQKRLLQDVLPIMRLA